MIFKVFTKRHFRKPHFWDDVASAKSIEKINRSARVIFQCGKKPSLFVIISLMESFTSFYPKILLEISRLSNVCIYALYRKVTNSSMLWLVISYLLMQVTLRSTLAIWSIGQVDVPELFENDPKGSPRPAHGRYSSRPQRAGLIWPQLTFFYLWTK